MATPDNNTDTGLSIRKIRAAATLPQSTAAPIFTVSGGDCVVLYLLGEVATTAIGAGANLIKLIANPTVGADVDLCATLDIDADAIGTMYNITGTFADAMIATTSGASKAQSDGFTVAPGTIDLSCNASSIGRIKWTIYYVPLTSTAKIVAA
jgi:hypothetical protein